MFALDKLIVRLRLTPSDRKGVEQVKQEPETAESTTHNNRGKVERIASGAIGGGDDFELVAVGGVARIECYSMYVAWLCGCVCCGVFCVLCFVFCATTTT